MNVNALIKIDVLEEINGNNNTMNVNNTNVRIFTDFIELKRSLLDKAYEFDVLNTTYDEVTLNDKGFIYLVAPKDNTCYNYYAMNKLKNVDKVIHKSFNGIEVFYNAYLPGTCSDLIECIDEKEFTKEYNRIQKFYTEDNGKGELEDEYMISIRKLFDKYNLSILRYEYVFTNGHYELTDANN